MASLLDEEARAALTAAIGDEGEIRYDEPMARHTTLRIGGPVDAWVMPKTYQALGRVRAAMGPDPVLVYRISLIDLVPDGSTWEEVVQLAKAVEAAGASVLNTGIGWHEARVPTIATSVPRAGFAHLTARLRPEVYIPVITSNRINAPEVAILGVSKSVMKPVWNGKEFAPRLVLPLSLSYDHRVIDGALAARFAAFLANQLGDIRRLLL